MRDILVHVTRYDAWGGAVQYAALLAAYLKASLTGLYCVEHAAIAGDDGLGIRSAGTAVDSTQAEGAFRAYAGSLGVLHSTWVVHDGDPAHALARLSHWHDLLVLGRSTNSEWESDIALADFVMRSHLPCVVVPSAPDLAPLRPLRVAVAWDGSLQAVRALHSATSLLERARMVFLLMGSPSGSLDPPSHLPAFDLDSYCQRHGIRTQRVALSFDMDSAGAAVCDAALGVEAEMLVMGAFRHARLRERLFDGVTQYLLRNSPLPVLLRH